LNVYLFSLFPISFQTPHRTTAKFDMQSRDDHVQDLCLVLVSVGIIVTKNDIFTRKTWM